MLKKLLKKQDYFFFVHPKNEYNSTGKYELHSIDSIEPLVTGYWSILRALVTERIMSKFYF